MTDEQIYAGLTEIFHEAFGDESIVLHPDTTAADIAGWDSMRMVLLIVAAEQRFGIKLRTREVDSLKCVADFARVISSKLNS